MDAKERFHQDYLAELAALDEFLARRDEERRVPAAAPAAVPAAMVDRQDPDVRRLLESVAYLSARTRQLAVGRMQRAVERWCAGLLDDLVAPMPAMGLVQLRPDARLVEAVRLERGTEVRLTAPDGASTIFTTLRPLELLPILRCEGEQSVEPARGVRIFIDLGFAASFNGPLGVLSFYLDLLGDYRSSLWFQEQLRAHLRRITVHYGDEEPDAARGEEAAFDFGAPAAEDERTPALGRIRSFFHLPEQDLFLHVALPPPPRPFRRARLVLEVDGRWPVRAAIDYRTAFQLFVVPIGNLRAAPAQPILCDGTRDEYPILAPPGLDRDAVLHSVRGVYQMGELGLQPIPPSLVAGQGATYEIEAVGEDQTRWRHQLHLRIPDAFLRPRRIIVQGLWYDPWFLGHVQGTPALRLQTRDIRGIALALYGELRPHAASPLWGDALRLLHLLGLRMKQRLEREDLVLLMELLGASRDASYRGLLDLVAEIEVREAPEPTRAATGVRTIYRLGLREADIGIERLGALRNLLLQIDALLRAWHADPVAIELRTPDRQPLLAGLLERGSRS